ncbi:MAG: response regulator [Myxococcales bacterium]|nr:response regulator [Deltaproteobacteria bacterium]MBT8480154.1 response regulator [Deltaproteobacteria bacterium]NNL23021.1 response regulator [Myxococcales bacterium]
MDREGQLLADREAGREARREQMRDEQMRLRSLAALQHVLPILAFIYAAGAVLFLLAPPFVPNAPHVLICAVAAALSLLVWTLARVDDPRHDTPASVATIFIAAGMGLAMFAFSGSLSNTATLAIAIMATAAVTYRPSIYAVMILIALVGWLPLALGVESREIGMGILQLVAASTVGGLFLWSRRQLMFSLYDQADEAEEMRQFATEQSRTLEGARDAALASAQAKGQFLANVSHEVRTPLNGILGLLQLIDANALPKPQDEYLLEVHKSGRALLAIVNDLLDLSKIEAGEMRLESVPFDVVSMTEEIAVNYASAAQGKSIELITHVGPEVPAEVCGDPLRLRQVISNLLSNALKFTKEGEVVVSVRVRDRGPWHVDLEVRVTDTGEGIPDARAESIFRPFSQADDSTTREHGGTGLGLPICRQLVALMGGELRVLSTVGQGSTFFFEARFELEERLSEELQAVTEALHGMKVLILESNNRARETLSAQLESWGMEPWATTTFDGALSTLRVSQQLNVMLIDLRSLGTDWRSRITELNTIAANEGISLVAICSYRHEIRELVETGIQVHVEKPIRRAKIIAALLETLNRVSEPAPASNEASDASLPPSVPMALQSNGMKVLVAEDNEINQRVVVAHLQALGYEVDAVNDGVAALEALSNGRHGYAAVIMDGQMPRMDGYQAAREQRARELSSGQRRVPIIALTAHAMKGDRSTALAAGMDDYLTKPFTRKELQRALNRWAARPAASISEFPPNALDTTITAQLLELDEEDPGFVSDVIDSFFKNAEENLARMRAAVENEDLEALHLGAHMIRGSSQQLGARRLGATTSKIETTRTIEEAGSLLDDLESDLEGAREALTALADRALEAAS